MTQFHWRTALCILVLAGTGLSLFGLWNRHGPERWTSNGLHLEAESSADGIIQVFFNDGDGLNEEDSTFRELRGGRPESLFFPLPARKIVKIRLDPIDQAGATVRVENAWLSGPMGWKWHRLDLSSHSKTNRLTLTTAQPGELELVSETDDPVILFRTEPSVLPAPFWASWAPRAAAFLVAWFLAAWLLNLFLFDHLRFSGWREVLVAIYGFGCYLFLMQFYAIPRQDVAFGWFYLWVPLAGIPVAALWFQREPNLLRNLVRQRSFWFFAAFFLYFTLRLLPMEHDDAPPKGELFSAYAILLLLPFTLAPVFQVIRSEQAWNVVRHYGMIAALTAALVLLTFYDQTSRDTDDIFPFGRIVGYNGVHKEIVGSAAYTTAFFGLLLCLARPQRPAWRIASVVALGFLFVYIQQCQSRGVVGASLVAMGTMFVLSRSRPLRILTVSFAAATLLYHLTPIPMYLAGFTEKPAELKLESYVDPARIGEVAPGKSSVDELTEAEIRALVPDRTELEVADKAGNRMATGFKKRPYIWQAYIEAGLKHPFFGNGFSGSHSVFVQGSEAWPIGRISSHSAFVSSFYFGGLVGLGVFAGMLFSQLGSAFRGLRIEHPPANLYALACGIVATLLLSIESVIIANHKVNVLCWNPNGYWIAVWMVLVCTLAWKAGETKSAGFPDLKAGSGH